MEERVLPRKLLGLILLRTFFLQASWNFEKLQNLGFFYVLAPALRFFYTGDDLSAACRRHLEYFNTHPYMASPVVGSVLALEEKNCRGEKSYLGIQEFKRMVMAPYAAMGDAFFWGGVRPAAAGVSLFFAIRGSYWAPVIFLVLYNVPHLYFRTVGLFQGYARGLKVVELLQRRRLPDMAIRIKEGTVVLLGGLCAYLTFFTLREESVPAGWGFAAAPAALLVGRLVHRGISPLLQVFIAATLLLTLNRIF